MSLLDQFIGGSGQPPRRPGVGSTIAAGVVLALLVKAVRASQARQQQGPEPRSFDPGQQPQGVPGGPQGGLLGSFGSLGGLLSGGRLPQALAGLGGVGALGALIDGFGRAGLGQQANSWVANGANQPVAPSDVSRALPDDALAELQRKTGLSRETLLNELANLLPQAINEATPQGRLPTDQELPQIAQPSSGAQ